DLRRAVEGIDTSLPWVPEARSAVLGGLDLPWKARASSARRAEQVLDEYCEAADSVRIGGLQDFDARTVRRQAIEVRAHLRDGGSLGFGPFKAQPVKTASSWLAAASVDGAKPTSITILDSLIAHLECVLAVSDLEDSWGPRLVIEESSFRITRAVVLEMLERLEPTLALEPMRNEARAALHRVDGVAEPDWSDVASVRRLEHIAGAVDAVERRADAQASITAVARRLASFASRPDAAPEVLDLAEAAAVADAAAYGRLHAALAEKQILARGRFRRDALFGRLSTEAGTLAKIVRDEADAAEWPARFATFGAAWNHARAAVLGRRWSES
ncbi:MAG: hypothetical protein ACMG6H_16925, partial [Acidobacteriota bacterium]